MWNHIQNTQHLSAAGVGNHSTWTLNRGKQWTAQKKIQLSNLYIMSNIFMGKNVLFLFSSLNLLMLTLFLTHSLPNYEYLVPNDCSLLCANDFKWDDFFSPWLWAQHFFSFSWAVIIKASPIASFPFVAPVAYDFQLPLEGIWHMILVLRAVNSSP